MNQPMSLGELLGPAPVTVAIDWTSDDPNTACVIYANGNADKPVIFLEQRAYMRVTSGDTSFLKSIKIIELFPPSN